MVSACRLLTAHLVNSADDLETLCDAMNEIDANVPEGGKLEKMLQRAGIDMSDLPVFSKNAPKSTDGIWSYDDDSVLVIASEGDFEIEDREVEAADAA